MQQDKGMSSMMLVSLTISFGYTDALPFEGAEETLEGSPKFWKVEKGKQTKMLLCMLQNVK